MMGVSDFMFVVLYTKLKKKLIEKRTIALKSPFRSYNTQCSKLCMK